MPERDNVVVTEKPWYFSKTNMLHIASLVLLAAETNFHLLQPHLGEQVFAYWLVGINVLGVVMRGVTKAPVTLT